MHSANEPVILVSTGRAAHPLSVRRTVSELYGAALEQAGLLSAAALGGDADALAHRFDGLLLSGGGDPDAAWFGEPHDPRAAPPDPLRDREELALCAAFCARKKPILAVCRGIQILNIHFGGNLVQHIDGHDGCPHPVSTVPGSALARLCGPQFTANSFHHQSVRQLCRGLWVTARAQDGTIEALEHWSLPILGVQWHPERMVPGLCADTAADHTALFAWMKSYIKDETTHESLSHN